MSSSETNKLYAAASHRYDRLTRLMSFGTGSRYRRRVVNSLHLPQGGTAVDLGCGTGGIALAMQDAMGEEGRILALDVSPDMLEEARRLGVRETVEGSMVSIPLPDDSVDGVVCGYSIRYAHDLDQALKEIKRVLRPMAPLVILEMTIPHSKPARVATSIIVRKISPPLMSICCGSRGIGKLMRHFWDSVATFPPPEEVLEKMAAAGLHRPRMRGPWSMLVEYRANG